MILPIVAYGAQILRKVSAPIDASYPSLPKLLEDMWETTYSSNGVGLAAPQINKDIRLFVIDSAQIFESLEPHEIGKYPDAPGVKKVMINAKIVNLTLLRVLQYQQILMLEQVLTHQQINLKFMLVRLEQEPNIQILDRTVNLLFLEIVGTQLDPPFREILVASMELFL